MNGLCKSTYVRLGIHGLGDVYGMERQKYMVEGLLLFGFFGWTSLVIWVLIYWSFGAF